MNRFVKSQPEETNTWGAEDLRWANMEMHPALDITVLRLLGGMEALDPVSSNQAAWRCFLSSSWGVPPVRSEEQTSELQSRLHLVCRLLLEKKKMPLFTDFLHLTSCFPARDHRVHISLMLQS